MRVSLGWIAVLAVAQGICLGQNPAPIQLDEPAGQLVREVVYNELNDHQTHGYWRYWIEKHTPKETRVEEQIETTQGPVTRLALSNGQPVSPEALAQEQARLRRLLTSPDEQARHLKEYEEDEQRIGRILALLPDAFLYTYAGEENGCHKLTFRPNPDYPAHSIEARIFHSMGGTLWVDARLKRLARLDGHVQENLDFGYGILGRLYKGGWFQLQRVQVGPTDWKTERLEVHMVGRALLVKSFARETSEMRGGFAPVPAGMNLAQGMALLDRTEARLPAPSGSRAGELVTATALALRH
jgi:hypothetical protein